MTRPICDAEANVSARSRGSLGGLVVAGASVLASIFWYGPTVLPTRQPRLVDWVEDRVFTILVGVVFALLAYEVLGYRLA
jgi:hypothetical protein